MANLNVMTYPLGEYIQNNIDFGHQFDKVPSIFSTNYFLRNREGEIATSKLAKKVRLHWAEKRVHGEVGAYETPTGLIPKYEDLVPMFKELIDEDYPREGYEYQFSFRCDEWIAKLERSKDYFRKNVPDCPQRVFDKWDALIQTIEEAKQAHGPEIKPGTYK